ncbi:hypothetical protein [Apibacter muscae]|nr:hypothetical protein [Apibacter muscae]
MNNEPIINKIENAENIYENEYDFKNVSLNQTNRKAESKMHRIIYKNV